MALNNNHSLTPNKIALPRIVSSLSVAQGYNDVYPKIRSERAQGYNDVYPKIRSERAQGYNDVYPKIRSERAQGYNDVYPKIRSERNEIKTQKYNTARTVPNLHKRIVVTEVKSVPLTYIFMTTHFQGLVQTIKVSGLS